MRRSTICRLSLTSIQASLLILSINAGAVLAQTKLIPNTFAELAKQVEPAVVSIDTKSKVIEPVAKGDPQPGDSDSILEFFRRQGRQRPSFGVGSGFIVDPAGYIMTNRHVVIGSDSITVRLESGEEFAGKVIGTDLETDLAVVKIDAGRSLPFLKFGDPSGANVGDWVLAVGSPFGLSKSVTAGIISQKQRETPRTSAFQRFIQTDAAINPGNSGGPLVDLKGDVIGVVSQIATSTGDFNGVAFAFPADQAKVVYEQILKNGRVRRGYLGAYLDSVKEEYAKVYGIKPARGAIITDIRDKRSPAALAGLKAGDVVVEMNGSPIENANDMIAKVAAADPDKVATFVYLREAGATMERKTASVKLGERPSNDEPAAADVPSRLPGKTMVETVKPFGLTLKELTAAASAKSRYPGQTGLLIDDIDPESYAADVRDQLGNIALAEGDLIQRINRRTVSSVKEFSDIVSKLKPGDPVVLSLLSYNQQIGAAQLKIVQFTVR
ncbi:MAG: trypsin-like peptidase domain-containing protein [Chloracidobacterium sp.]|nr:trypsin-like peptidase domain-containing protein [Chloracidobacterium sp.]MCO5333489.1 trypsin-like peptidase domain-containing protein [Pyrinomonadaceae bacterium]